MGNGFCSVKSEPLLSVDTTDPGMSQDPGHSQAMLRDLLATLAGADDALIALDDHVVASGDALIAYQGSTFAAEATAVAEGYDGILATLAAAGDGPLLDGSSSIFLEEADQQAACGGIDARYDALHDRDHEISHHLSVETVLPERPAPPMGSSAARFAANQAASVPFVLDRAAEAVALSGGADPGEAALALQAVVVGLDGADLAFVRRAIRESASFDVREELAALETAQILDEPLPEGFDEYEEWRIAVADWREEMSQRIQSNVEAILGAIREVGDAADWNVSDESSLEGIATMVKFGVGLAGSVLLTPAVGFLAGFIVGKVADAFVADRHDTSRRGRTADAAKLMVDLYSGSAANLEGLLEGLAQMEQGIALRGLGLAMGGDLEGMWAVEPSGDAVVPTDRTRLVMILAQRWIRYNSRVSTADGTHAPAGNDFYSYDKELTPADREAWLRMAKLAGPSFTRGYDKGVEWKLTHDLHEQEPADVGVYTDMNLAPELTHGTPRYTRTGLGSHSDLGAPEAAQAEDPLAHGPLAKSPDSLPEYQAFLGQLSAWRARQRANGLALGTNVVGALTRLGNAVHWNPDVLADLRTDPFEERLHADAAGVVSVQDGISAGAAAGQHLANLAKEAGKNVKGLGTGLGLAGAGLNLVLDLKAGAESARQRKGETAGFQDNFASTILGGFSSRTDWAMGHVAEVEEQILGLELMAARLVMSGETTQFEALLPKGDAVPLSSETNFYLDLVRGAMAGSMSMKREGSTRGVGTGVLAVADGRERDVQGLHNSLGEMGMPLQVVVGTDAVMMSLGIERTGPPGLPTFGSNPTNDPITEGRIVDEVRGRAEVGTEVTVQITWLGDQNRVAPSTVTVRDGTRELRRVRVSGIGPR